MLSREMVPSASYTWDFGDGIAFSASDSLVHTYQIAKVVSPGLTVTNSFRVLQYNIQTSANRSVSRITGFFHCRQTSVLQCAGPGWIYQH